MTVVSCRPTVSGFYVSSFRSNKIMFMTCMYAVFVGVQVLDILCFSAIYVETIKDLFADTASYIVQTNTGAIWGI